MQFTLTEPTDSKDITFNALTNKVHVVMPIVAGTRISLNNTEKSVKNLQDFFGKSTDKQRLTIKDKLLAYQHIVDGVSELLRP